MTPPGTQTGLTGLPADPDTPASNASPAGFEAFLEAAPDAVVVVGRGGRITLVNSLTEKMFGYTRDELIGNPVEMLVPEQLRQAHVHDREGYERNPRTRPMG